jgi:hypothetical protein
MRKEGKEKKEEEEKEEWMAGPQEQTTTEG